MGHVAQTLGLEKRKKELKWLFRKRNINNTQTVMNLTVTFCEVSLDYHTHFNFLKIFTYLIFVSAE